jgi:hypothetical protein
VLTRGQSVLNTDVRRELDHFAAFLQGAVNHKAKIGVRVAKSASVVWHEKAGAARRAPAEAKAALDRTRAGAAQLWAPERCLDFPCGG